MTLCINCIHCQGHQFNKIAQTCGHPDLQELSLVNGKSVHPICEGVRMFGDCGREGTLFELKEVTA